MILRDSTTSSEVDPGSILRSARLRDVLRGCWIFAGVGLAASVFAYAGVLAIDRYWGAASTISTLARDSIPPDFARWRSWMRPLLDTLAMSLSGTLLGVALAAPAGMLSAPNVGPVWIGGPLRLLLRVLRAVPCLVWGIVFVAALGFGPLPGCLCSRCPLHRHVGQVFTGND